MSLITEESQRISVSFRITSNRITDFSTKFISRLEKNSWAIETVSLEKSLILLA